jgi:hypothetical protein
MAGRLAQSAYEAHLTQTIARDGALGISSGDAKPKFARQESNETSINHEKSEAFGIAQHERSGSSPRELNVVPSVSGIAIILRLESLLGDCPGESTR